MINSESCSYALAVPLLATQVIVSAAILHHHAAGCPDGHCHPCYIVILLAANIMVVVSISGWGVASLQAAGGVMLVVVPLG